jgi:hypothetical protein
MKSAIVMRDLPLIKELDASEMTVVRGGTKFVIQPFPSHGGVDDYCGTVPHPKGPPIPVPLPPHFTPIKLRMPGMVYVY